MRQTAKPWEALGMSRASWYRHGKPDRKPERETNKVRAEESRGVSLRTYYRHQRAYWHEFWRRRDEAMRAAGFNGPWDKDGIKAWLDRHPEQVKALHDELEQVMDTKLEKSAAVRDLRALLGEIEAKAAAHPEMELIWQLDVLASRGRLIGTVRGHTYQRVLQPPPPPQEAQPRSLDEIAAEINALMD